MLPMLVTAMSYWDCYLMPVQFRRYMIQSYMRIEDQKAESRENHRVGMQKIAQQGLPKHQPGSFDYLSKPQR